MTSPTPDEPGFPAVLFTRPNRPFTLLLVGAVVALGAYLYLSRDEGPAASGTTVAAGTDQTSLPASGDASSTTAAGEPTTSTTTTTPPEAPAGPLQGLAVEALAEGLTFPVFAASPPGDPRIFVATRPGMIRIIDPDEGLLDEPFLDLTELIDSESSIELGLLGLAFHPQYSANNRFFVSYTDLNSDSVLSEFTVGEDPDVADPGSEQVLLFVDQIGARHRGGMAQFGLDGFLYLALGDGTDFEVNPQNLETLQGSLLRLDVDGGAPYAIPADNPFVADEGRPEIWAFGFRNPWRFAFDAAERRIYIADVGEDSWEEINVISLDQAGANFGWPLMEGSTCFTDADCGERTDLVRPVVEYSHEEGCAVTGGHVYRGAAIPELDGHYFYGDWCEGWMRSFLYDGEEATQPLDWVDALGGLGQIASFGLDSAGELLVVTSDTGAVYRVVPVR